MKKTHRPKDIFKERPLGRGATLKILKNYDQQLKNKFRLSFVFIYYFILSFFIAICFINRVPF